MKRLVTLLILLLLASAPASARLRVVTTTTNLADIVRQVGGERVEVTALCRGYQNPHSIETKPSYLRRLQEADAFLMMGLDLEIAWAPSLLRSARNPRIMPGSQGFLECSRGIRVLQKPQGRVDRTSGDVHPLGNPHYTLSPDNVKIVAYNVTGFLKRLDPQGGPVYDEGYRRFWHRIDEADRRWRKRLEPFKGARIVTYHATWPYFAEHFGLEVVDHVEPKPGISPSSAHLDHLVERMKAQGVKVIVMETWFSDDLPRALAEKTGARVLRLPIAPGGVPGADDYVALMDYIVEQLVKALQ